ncbi:asparagine synthase (glutamine-hydrolyzing) [Maridesulfovibrio sp.]|uniref:asparagine synthase (glutamine-hydrolyzing) n=1 Tax=Maridesulfovibrio sp. TaxID=2795000 RepID=UPI002A189709|nr:asparagine synthase (glutamine-hydrolyzing) [Maridesulfovibrio sp.]
MCGIIGRILLNDGSGGGASGHGVAAALDLIGHRGPDGRGCESLQVCGNEVEFGHTRLSILDLSPAGAQPMFSRDRRWLLTFNGEIYNHLSIRGGLEGPFRGTSDTETLVESLAAVGLGRTLELLNGMFAFAALDTVDRKLYLARDPYGIKPLYYTGHETFCFASEIKALLAVSGLDPAMDMQSLQTYLTLRFVPSPQTLYKGVAKLRPGHVLELSLDNGRMKSYRYAGESREVFEGSIADARNAYRERLAQAVEGQLLSDVPVGVLLSGGIDSALVAAMAARRMPGITGFTVGFEHNVSECEIDDAAGTAEVLGIKHEYVRLGERELLECVQSVASSVEEPLGTTSMLAMWHLAALARRDVTVVLTGQGSDEPWGGYLLYQAELLRRMIPFPGLAGCFSGLVGRIPGLPDAVYRGVRMVGIPDEALRFCEARALFSADERRELTGREDSGHAVSGIRYWLESLSDMNMASAEKMMRVDMHMNLPDDLLLYGDKITMAVALEARVPMLDLRLMDFVNSLPLEFRVRLGRRKVVHREMALEFLPSEIVNRPKKGFGIPFGSLARTGWKEYLHSVLLDDGAGYLSVVNRKGVQRVWDRHQCGARDCSRQLFSLMMLACCFDGMRG